MGKFGPLRNQSNVIFIEFEQLRQKGISGNSQRLLLLQNVQKMKDFTTILTVYSCCHTGIKTIGAPRSSFFVYCMKTGIGGIKIAF